MRSVGFLVAASALAILAEIVQGGDPEKLEPYIVMLKKKKPLAALEHRVKERSADASIPHFKASIDHRAVFGASPEMPGFKMISSQEAAEDVAKDPDVLFVEHDSEISIDDY